MYVVLDSASQNELGEFERIEDARAWVDELRRHDPGAKQRLEILRLWDEKDEEAERQRVRRKSAQRVAV